MKKLFTFLFAVVLLISFACSLPEPPPVPGITNSSSSNTYSSNTNSGGSPSPVQSTSSYSTQSYSDKKGFFGGIDTMLLKDGSFSWFRFLLLFAVFIVILIALIYLSMQRKKSLVNNSSAINNEKK